MELHRVRLQGLDVQLTVASLGPRVREVVLAVGLRARDQGTPAAHLPMFDFRFPSSIPETLNPKP